MNLEQILKRVPADQRSTVEAIITAFSVDEIQSVDKILEDVKQNRFAPFDVIYVDLSIDRSTNPLRITGAGTFIHGAEATDDLANVSIGFPGTESDEKKRISVYDGKRLYLPFTEFFIYNAAQAGKYIKLLRGRELPSMQMGIEDDSGESANSDLVIALGNSSAFSTDQVTVTSTATSIIAANTARKRITIRNNDVSNPVFIGVAGVTAADGWYLPAGAAVTLNTNAAIFGITASGSVTVSYLEE